MTDFAFTELVPTEAYSTALGATNTGTFSIADVGKPVKLSASNTYDICVANDEIEGFVSSVESFTVNNGYSFGGIIREGRKEVVVGAAQTGAIAIGSLVVADVQTALGTVGKAAVKTGVPTKYLWRVVSIVTGTGVSGDVVLVERD